MTATDELRRLLDERGVEWTEADNHTLWWGESTHHQASAYSSILFGESERVHLSAMVTPEQAIAATLGAGECTLESAHGYWDPYVRTAYQIELSCHTLDAWDDPVPPSYCPYCGKRVVKEDA